MGTIRAGSSGTQGGPSNDPEGLYGRDQGKMCSGEFARLKCSFRAHGEALTGAGRIFFIEDKSREF